VDHTLQTTALVHEAYLKLVEQTSASWQNRAHFFAIAAQIMRHILIDHARAQLREKRGGGQSVIQLDEGLVFSPEQSSELLEVDTALHRLAELDPRQSKIVELRFFGRVPRPSRVLCERAGFLDVTIPSGNPATMTSTCTMNRNWWKNWITCTATQFSGG
jgi:hypothetical protein